MVKKGNAPVPNAHFHKHWNPTGSQKGHVRCFFKQGPQKKIRRARRQKKAAAVFPRPVKGPLRPIVHCKSQRFNMKTRLGRGFTTLELKTAGLTDRRYARTIGISVDRRRRNHCEESLALNAERIKTYLSKLVLFPLKAGKKLPEGVTEEDIKNPVQSKQDGFPKASSYGKNALKPEAPRKLTDQEKKRLTFQFLRKVQRDTKMVGKRIKRKAKKEAKAAKEAAKQK
uniref:60S large subunit ribosomal protein eL13 n=1 Tax=Euglena gracilis TaxID=3039 RepID=A0A7L5NWR3_EUGGR|nr:60S large subunit ribosomal protein eL13 [Euglena gracilis]6ZJ3_LX Chain LX, Ribosomal protein eL13 [Euglena gracilis]